MSRLKQETYLTSETKFDPERHVGYRSTVPGDESTIPIPAAEFELRELVIRNEIIRLDAIVESGRKAKAKIKELQTNCKHLLFKDFPEDGSTFDYFWRKCMVCGHEMGSV